MSEVFKQQMKGDAARIEAYLASAFRDDERYADLQEAMEYSLMAGGKRLRPVLVLECCKLCGGNPDKAIPFAAAVILPMLFPVGLILIIIGVGAI